MDAGTEEFTSLDSTEPANRVSVKLLAALVTLGIILDQTTKIWAVRTLSDRDPIPLLPTLEFDLYYNRGFSFGTGQGAGPLIGVVVIGLSAYLIHLLRKETSKSRAVILAVVLSGALGNLLDRIFRADDGPLSGAVIDFIDVSWFAIFNIADIFVVCGIIVFGATEILAAKQEQEQEEKAEAEAAVTAMPETEITDR